MISEIDDIAVGGDIVISIAGSISIRVSLENEFVVAAEEEDPMCWSTSQISENAFCNLPVIFGWSMHELRQVSRTKARSNLVN